MPLLCWASSFVFANLCVKETNAHPSQIRMNQCLLPVANDSKGPNTNKNKKYKKDVIRADYHSQSIKSSCTASACRAQLVSSCSSSMFQSAIPRLLYLYSIYPTVIGLVVEKCAPFPKRTRSRPAGPKPLFEIRSHLLLFKFDRLVIVIRLLLLLDKCYPFRRFFPRPARLHPPLHIGPSNFIFVPSSCCSGNR